MSIPYCNFYKFVFKFDSPYKVIIDGNFAAIALNKKFEGKNRMGNPHLKRVKNPLENSQTLATAALIAPLAGAMAAGIAVYKNVKKSQKDGK